MTPNRDLLVMFRQSMMSEKDIERQVMLLHELLFNTERLDNFVGAHEILDVNRRRIVRSSVEIKKMLRQKKLDKAFIFFSNKN